MNSGAGPSPQAGEGLAPVIPIFGAHSDPQPAPAWNATWADDVADREDDDGFDGARGAGGGAADAASDERDLAEKTLLKRLRTRSLSMREARAVVGERDLAPHDVEAVLDAFVRIGYLDDAKLAEQLVHAAVDRKGQGRQVIAQTLAKRGIPRDVADAAIATLPDDDAERALEFARTKARSLAKLDHDTALRRLMGQLARRGYGGSVASTAARQALSEAGATTSGVRFR